ncbi:hypothetical protein ACQP04_11955 [Pseudonocardia halophobica]|uniref:hypothetical protein n=1 Tax=Pseudonocardia halophobica TaxID=29401 RepID=UPI003D910D7D
MLSKGALPVQIGHRLHPELIESPGHRLAYPQRLHELGGGRALPGGGRERVDGLVEQAPRVGHRAGEHDPILLEHLFEHKVKSAARAP